MGRLYKARKPIFLMMLGLLLFQYVAPVAAVAQVLMQKNAQMTLVEAKKGEADNQIALSVDLEAGETEESLEIQSSEKIFSSVAFADTSMTDTVSLHDTQDNIQLSVQPAEESVSKTILLTIKDGTSLKNGTVDYTYQDQTISYQLPDQYVAADQTTTTSSEATGSTSTTTSESETTTPSSEESNRSDRAAVSSDSTSGDDQTTDSSEEVSHEATDIRTYFPNGTGTILTDTKISYKNEAGEEVQPPLTDKMSVLLYYMWQIPEDVRKQIVAGDYFDFQLPDQLKPNRTLSGELKTDGSDEVYATYTVDTDGHVVFTFTENVTTESDIKGDYTFDTHFDKAHLDGPGNTTITFPAEDQLPPVDVFIRPDTEKEIDKQGHFDRTPNPSAVTWTIDFNHAMHALTNPTITESWPKGIDYQSVKVYELVMNLDGTIKAQGRLLDPSEYTVNQKGNVTVNGSTQNAYRLIYQTAINQSIIPDKGGQVPFVNQAMLTDDNDPDGIDAKATVTANYGKLLTKQNIGYDSGKQQFSWRIKYNYGEKKIEQSQAHLTDTTSNNLEFVSSSIVVRPISFDTNGKETVGQSLEAGKDYQVVPASDGHGFTLQFLKDVDQAYQIDYKTDVNQIVDGTTDVSNQVSVNDEEHASSNGQAQQQNVIKNIGTIDYANRTVDWSISVNKNHYAMTNLVLTDTYAPAHGLSMALRQGAQYNLDIRDKTANVTLQPNKDYTIVLTTDNDGYQTGFVVHLIGDYASTDHELTINYRTNFDVSNLDPDQSSLNHFTNGINANWYDQNGDEHHSNDHKDFKPNYPYALNAQKSGVYNVVTKTITWTVAVNLSGNQLENATLIDPVLNNQSYLSGSLKVFNAQTNPDGSVTKRSEQAVNAQMRKVTEPNVLNEQTIEVDFPNDIAQTYLIEFQTSVAAKVIGKQGDYTNVAKYANNGEVRKVTGEVSVKYGGELVEKTGAQDAANPDYVNWQMLVNPSQSTLSNVKITDTPSTNQVIDQSSVQLFQTEVAADGTITPNMEAPLTVDKDFTVAVTTNNATGQQEMIVILANKITTAYYMTYRSFITSSAAGNTDKVSNNVKVTGDNTEEVSGDNAHDVTVQIDHSSGNASGEKGRLILQKTDSDGTTPLTGAHFELWDTTKSQLLREGDVSKLGQITFGTLPFGDYLLFETTAPDGYTVSNDLAKGKRVTITAANTGDQVSPLVLENERSKVILHKVDTAGNPITSGQSNQTGAQFKIERLNRLSVSGNNWDEVAIDPNTTDQNGDLVIESLPVGIYRATEIAAPTGYILDPTPHSFIVAKTDKQQIPTVEVTVTNAQGTAALTKTSDTGEPLAGATFDVLDQKGNPVNDQPLVSDEDGLVRATDLAPGSYSFKETKAPTGYLINTTLIPFDITDSQAGEPDVVTVQPDGTTPIALVDYQGSASLKKTDEAGNPLAGAAFNVINEADQVVNSSPIIAKEDGTVTIDHLAPGNYQFVETKAPDGYLLNTEAVAFTIGNEAKGAPVSVDAGSLKNYQASFSIRKTDTAGNGLAGADFTLYNSDKEKMDVTMTADKDGRVVFSDLAPGTYYYQEIKAPAAEDGTAYIINPALIRVDIPTEYQGDPGVFDQGDFQNFRGKAEVTKKGDGGSIAGATFDLYRITDGEQTLAEEITVGENGVLDLADLGVGSYKLVEIDAASGYVINTQPIYFVIKPEVDDEEGDNLDFSNYQSELIGQKVNQAGEGLANASYQIYKTDTDGQVTGMPIRFATKDETDTDTIVTNQAGEIYAKGLEAGSYVLVETNAPSGYILDETQHPFTIKDQLGKPTPVDLGDLVNYQGSVQLRKTNADHSPLSGASFDLLDDNDQVVNESALITDESGLISVDGLAPGTYHFKETQAPDGYLINTASTTFTIEASQPGKPAQIALADFIDYQGSASLIKTDSRGNGLAGAVFDVLDSQDNVVNTEPLITNQNGRVQMEDLAPGDYRFVETQAPAGYILNDTPVTFTINDAAEGQPQTIEAGTLVNYQGRAEWIKTDEAGNGLQGATFAVLDQDGNEVATTASGKDGHVQIAGLAPGNYQFKETKAPESYVINDQRVSFTIDPVSTGAPEILHLGNFVNFKGSEKLVKTAEDGTPLANVTFDVLDDQDNQINNEPLSTNAQGEIEVDDLAPGNYRFVEHDTVQGYILNTDSIAFTIPNHAARKPVLSAGTFINYQGSAVLKKTNEEGQPLQGAAFEVFDADGKRINVDDLITDTDGLISIGQLAPGDYTFVEISAPSGHIVNEQAVPFTINESASGEPEAVFAGTMIDYQGSATLLKTDEDDTPLAGAIFKVIDETGATVAENLASSEEGIVTVDGLAPGQYSFVETQAPTGYLINDQAISFEIATSAIGAPAVVDAGTMIDYQGSATLLKTDEDDTPLAGAIFKVIDETGATVAENLASSEEGIVTVDGLAPGQYSFVETQAPTGYLINDQAISFEIATSAIGAPAVVDAGTMIDYQGSATLLKTDEDDTPLAGAIFKVIDETGATVAENLASSEEGIVTVDGLAPGQYSFVETQAPKGYQISDEAIKFVIASHAAGQPTEVDAGQLINHLMPNTPNTPNTPEKPSGKLPKTNDTSNRWFALIGGSIVVLTSTAGFYFNKKRKS